MIFKSLLSPQKKTDEIHFSLDIDEFEIPFSVKTSARAKRLILRPNNKGIGFTITRPKFVSFEQTQIFAMEQKNWILKQFKGQTPQKAFKDQDLFFLYGQPITIKSIPEKLRGTVTLDENILVVPGHRNHLHRKTVDYLKLKVRNDISELARKKAARINKKITRIRIADQKTRWGSCSTKGTLSFSCRLVFTPEFVVDYVVAHEVAHMVHMNHSERFWALCNDLCNGNHMGQAKKWLKDNGKSVMTYKMTT